MLTVSEDVSTIEQQISELGYRIRKDYIYSTTSESYIGRINNGNISVVYHLDTFHGEALALEHPEESLRFREHLLKKGIPFSEIIDTYHRGSLSSGSDRCLFQRALGSRARSLEEKAQRLRDLAERAETFEVL